MPATKKAASPSRAGRLLRRAMLAESPTAGAVGTPRPRGGGGGPPPPPGGPAPDPRIAAIHAAKEGAEIVLAELLHRSDEVVTADAMAELQPEIELARGIVDDCTQKEIDLTAASVVITPLDPASVTKLQSLAEDIDKATVRSAVLNATLSGLGAVLNSAIRINAML